MNSTEVRCSYIPTSIGVLLLLILAAAAPGPDAGILSPDGTPTDVNFFPIGVWLQSPGNAAAYKATGVNLYIGLYNGPVPSQLEPLKAVSMPALCDQNAFALATLNRYGSAIAGWTQVDEPDNAQSDGKGGYAACVSPDTIIKRYTRMRQADPTRPVFLNLGQGVAWTSYYGRGPDCANRTDMYPRYLQGCDIACFDVYPVNGPDAEIRGKLWYVAKGIDSLRAWGGTRKSVWAWFECTSINGGTKPTPAQVRSEIWMALIHGAKGIGYFCHSFSPAFDEAAWLSDPAMKAALTALNRRVASLAAALNSPSVAGAVSVASSNKSVPIDVLVKNQGGAVYVFAASMRNDTATARFTLRGPAAGAAAEVLDENRTVPVVDEAFSDHFAGYGVHLYKFIVSTKENPPAHPKPSGLSAKEFFQNAHPQCRRRENFQ